MASVILLDDAIYGKSHPDWYSVIPNRATFFTQGDLDTSEDLDNGIYYTELSNPNLAVRVFDTTSYWTKFRGDRSNPFNIVGNLTNAGVPIRSIVQCYDQDTDRYIGTCIGMQYGFNNLKRGRKYYLVAKSLFGFDQDNTLPAKIISDITDVIEAIDEPIQNGLIGSWKFNGNLQDNSLLGNHAQVSGTASYVTDVMGNSNSGLLVSGSTISVPYTPLYDFGVNTPYSVSLWFKCGTATTGTIFLFGNKSDINSGWAWGCVLNDSANGLSVYNRRVATTDDLVARAGMNTQLRDGLWYHICWTYDGSMSLAGYKFYINNQEVPQVAGGVSTLTPGTRSSPEPLNFGTATGYTNGFHLDDVRLYSRIITVDEVDDLYHDMKGYGNVALEPVQNGLIGSWPLNGSLLDNSLYCNHGQPFVADPTTTYATSLLGDTDGALSADPYGMILPYCPMYDFTTTTPFSISFWYNGTGFPGIIGNMTLSDPYPGWYMHMSTSSTLGLTLLMRRTISDEIRIHSGTTAPINDGNWHHICVTYDGSRVMAGCKFYVDSLVDAVAGSSGTLTNGPMSSSSGLYVGPNRGTSPNFLINEVKLFNRVLTAAEVATLHDSYATKLINNEPVSVGLMNSWRFQNNLLDSGPNRNHLTCTAPTFSPGYYAQSTGFTSTANLITGPINAPYNFERTQPFSISFWYKSGTSTIGYVMVGNVSAKGWYLWIGNSGRIILDLRGTASSNELAVELTSVNLMTNTWRHVVVTYDGLSVPSSIVYYIDGVYVPWSTIINNTLSQTIVSTNPLYMMNGNGVGGQMDELKLFNKVLSASEVNAIYKHHLYAVVGISYPPTTDLSTWTNETSTTVTTAVPGGYLALSSLYRFSQESQYSILKTGNSDPSGGWWLLPSNINLNANGFELIYYTYRELTWVGGSGDDIGLLNSAGNGLSFRLFRKVDADIIIRSRAAFISTDVATVNVTNDILEGWYRHTIICTKANGGSTANIQYTIRDGNETYIGVCSYNTSNLFVGSELSRLQIMGGNNYWIDRMSFRIT